jgi:flagellar hook-associated protein 1 FlgK
MGTISSALGIISGALDADQSALNIVANNVANAGTAGYTEETSNFVENDPITINGVSCGTGVTETGAISVRDKVLMERLDQQQQQASSSSTRLTALESVQGLFSVDSGSTSSSTAGDIGSDLTSFFSSFSSLEAYTSSTSLRDGVLSAAKTLASDISGTAKSLTSQKAALDQESAGVTTQVNALTSAIAALNKQIMSTSPNSDAGTLENQREEDVSELSKLVGINQITTEKNGLSITTTSGASLVSGDTSSQITNGTVDGVTHFFVGTTDVTSGLTTGGGELSGYLTVRDTDIPNTLASLDQLAYSVSTAVNSLNNSGVDQEGNTGTAAAPLYIFSEPTEVSGSAASMSVVITNAKEIATAASGKASGDDTNAIAMAKLNSSTSTIVDGQSPSNYYSSFVSALGSTVSEVKTENTAQESSVTQLQTQCNALSKVNLNDEAASMTTFERSYQAASEVFSILNTLMASILNLGEQTTVS